MTLVVDIKKEDIKLGKQFEPESCAVARRLRFVDPKAKVTAKTYTVFGRTHKSPPKLVEFVDRFDSNKSETEPTTLVLEV